MESIFNGIPSGKISLEAGPRMAATTGWQFIYTEDQDMQGNHMKGLILQWQYLPWL